MTDPIAAVADALVNARRTGQPAPSSAHARSITSTEQALQVQQQVARSMNWSLPPGQPGLWKTGASSTDGPFLHGELPLDGLYENRVTLPVPAGQHWAVEAEIAFRLRDDVRAAQVEGLTAPSEAADLFADLAPAIEVVGSRWDEGLKTADLLRLADLQSHQALVLGHWYPFRSLDWQHMGVTVQIGDRPLVEARGSHPLRHPTIALLHWLKDNTAGGRVLPAGAIVTTGSWVGAIPVAAGERVRVHFDAIGEVTLDL
jgi:2-keto-4-pentenoate hydratase